MRQIARVMLAFALLCATAHAQSQWVRVTVAKANVRSEPSDKAPILQQATPRDQIEWRATEGDWFKVLLPPNPGLGGARVEAYISKKVSKLEAAKAMPASAEATAGKPREPAPPAAPAIDTHAANVFLGTIVGGTLLPAMSAEIRPGGGREQWIVRPGADAVVSPNKRPSFVVSIGDRAGFSVEGLVPSLVKLSTLSGSTTDLVAGSTKGGKGWKSDEVSVELIETAAGVWNIKLSKDLKPGSYALVMTPSSPKDPMPEIAWAFTVK
jgi:hypothetical protein